MRLQSLEKCTWKLQQKKKVSSSRFELETVCVLDRRDNQLHHEDCAVSGFWYVMGGSSAPPNMQNKQVAPRSKPKWRRTRQAIKANGKRKEKKVAWSGNRTRVSRVAGENYTTKPTMLALLKALMCGRIYCGALRQFKLGYS